MTVRPKWLADLKRQEAHERYLAEITNGAWKKTTAVVVAAHKEPQ